MFFVEEPKITDSPLKIGNARLKYVAVEPEPLTSFLMTFYNSGSLYFLSPCYFKRNRPESAKSARFTLVNRGASFRFLLAVLHFWTLFSTGYDHYYVLTGNTDRKWQTYFALFLVCVWTIQLSNAILNIWTNGRYLKETLNKVAKISGIFEKLGIALPSAKFMNAFSLLLVIFVLGWSLQSEFLWNFILPVLQGKSVASLVNNRICSHELLSCTKVQMNTSEEASLTWPSELFEIAIHFGHSFTSEIASHYTRLLIIAHSIIFYIIVRQFIEFLESNHLPGPGHMHHFVLELFEEICQLCEIMEKAIGSVVSATCFLMLVYYSYKAQGIFNSSSPMNSIKFLVDGIVVGIFLILASEAHSKLDYLRIWLQISRTELKFGNSEIRADWQDRVHFSLNQLQSGKIGIRSRFFTITYGFVGSLLSMILTYSLLISQLYSPE